MKTRRVLLTSACLASTMLLGATAALAQAAPAQIDNVASPDNAVAPKPSDPEPQSARDIVVTGSRIQSSGFQAPTPVTVVTAQQLVATSPGTIAEAVALLPSMRFSGPQDTRSGTQGGSGGAYLNLRNLTAVRTLTLLDGRRVVGGTSQGSVDANMIPTALLERVDIVTGGASAAYGSDAVAGVVNFVLNKRYNGQQAELQYGLSSYGDNQELKFGLAAGRPFARDRGHVLFSVEGYDSKGVDCQCSRPVERDSWSIILNPAYALVNGVPNGQPRRILRSDVRTTQSSYGGLIISGTGAAAQFNGLTFNPDGSTRRAVFGSITSGSNTVGGDLPRISDETIQSAPNRHGSVFGRLSYDVTDAITVYAEGIYSMTRVYFSNGASDSIGTSALIIRAPTATDAGNAYLNQFNPTLATQLRAAGVAQIRVGRRYNDLSSKDTYQRTWTQRYVTGANANLGGTWKADVYYEYGKAKNDSRVPNNLNLANLFLAQDAVLVTAANAGASGLAVGSIACRSTLTAPTNGCVPVNPFGSGNISEAAKKYILGQSHAVATIRQDVVAASVNGQLIDLWAGPLAVAAGAEYRKEGFAQTADAISQAINPYTNTVGAYRNANPQPQSGGINVKEAFAEVDLPLAKDIPLLQELNLNAAVRLTDYSTSGKVTSWKVGLQWKPIESVRFRGTRSRDIRAPNINDLFLGGTQTFANINDPTTGTTIGNVRQITRGNPGLVPEKADTTALGIVFRPGFLPSFNMSVDVYNIDIKGAIATQTAQQTVDNCQAGSALSCSAVQRNAAGGLTEIDLIPFNLASLKTRGIDFEVAYRAPLDQMSVPGTLSLNLRGTYVDKLELTSPGTAPIDRAGDVGTLGGTYGNQPRWRATALINYAVGAVSLNVQERFVGGGRLDTLAPGVSPYPLEKDIDKYTVPGRFYIDARLGFTFAKKAEFYVASTNLFNKAPPIPPNSAVYDSVGRMIRVGLRFKS